MIFSDDFERLISEKAKEAAERQKRLSKIEIMSGADLMKQNFPEQKFIWDSILPDSGLAVMAASKAAGKTLFLLQLTDAVSRGRDFLGLPTKLTKTLFIELELSARRTQQRLLKMGLVANDMLHFAHRWTPEQEGLQTIADAVREHEYGLVIVDVMQMLWPAGADTNSYQDVYSVLAPLRNMANELNTMIVLVTHRRKAEAADRLDETIGSVAIQANADVILSIIRTRGEQDAVLFVDGNDIESKKIALRFNTDPLGFTLSDSAPEEIGLTQERREIVDAIRELGGTAKPGQIETITGKERSVVSHLLAKMARDGIVFQEGYGKYSIHSIHSVHSEPEQEQTSVNSVYSVNSTSEDTVRTGSTESVRLGTPAAEWPAALQSNDDEQEPGLGIF